ncbi:hypothetical protein LNP04_06205 [Chryseobacterium sp. C-71]|uniref:hypothetical protein n=1 Tax=Chryseobacterium sp. C-71 TaxID=2893882 RepID=UPI001E35974D|nr:hypothetical protein [Chryseobacterium sp. C-71]UFH33308.1 hypothetical protein LNP04_06205 [Chryseobacterium sp. C-71]
MIDTNIYYIPKDKGILITSNFAEIQKRMDIGMDPVIEFIKTSITDLNKYEIKGFGFDNVDNTYFQSIKEVFAKYKFETIAFHETTADLSDVVLDVEHLVVGQKSKINISEKNFKNLKEITFLSVKTFKGKILDKFKTVEKLILWYENQKSNTILENFPNLKEFYIYNGSIMELNLTENPHIEKLQLHRCIKLEKVILPPSMQLKKVIVEACNKLDTYNLPINRESLNE